MLYNALSMEKNPKTLPLGFRHPVREGPSHCHEQHVYKNLLKIARVVPEISSPTDIHTDRHTDAHTIDLLRNRMSYVCGTLKVRSTLSGEDLMTSVGGVLNGHQCFLFAKHLSINTHTHRHTHTMQTLKFTRHPISPLLFACLTKDVVTRTTRHECTADSIPHWF